MLRDLLFVHTGDHHGHREPYLIEADRLDLGDLRFDQFGQTLFPQ